MEVTIENLSPSEIDESLYKGIRNRNSLKRDYDSSRSVSLRMRSNNPDIEMAEWLVEYLSEKDNELNEAIAWVEALENEFTRRGGWNRYYLVIDGHVHRELRCSTCRPTTFYSWLTELADCDESKMVAEYGEVACSVCFPDAPAN
jgi:UDP-2,3-diacylglucosamine pyrophosphatase LpxH